MATSSGYTSAYRDLEQGSPPVAKIAELLRSGDDGVVHAAVLHLEARLRGGEVMDGLARLLPSDILGMPPESQLVLARLAVDGFQVPVPEAAPDVPPSVRLSNPRGCGRARLDIGAPTGNLRWCTALHRGSAAFSRGMTDLSDNDR